MVIESLECGVLKYFVNVMCVFYECVGDKKCHLKRRHKYIATLRNWLYNYFSNRQPFQDISFFQMLLFFLLSLHGYVLILIQNILLQQ